MKLPIPIAKPCTADWNAMTGDNRTRLCAQCDKHVHNLSALTPGELADFAAKRDGTECIGYVFHTDGSIVTAGKWDTLFRWMRPVLRGPVWLLALLLPTLFSGCARTLGKPANKGQVLPGAPAPINRTARAGHDGELILGKMQPLENRVRGEVGVRVGKPNPGRPTHLGE